MSLLGGKHANWRGLSGCASCSLCCCPRLKAAEVCTTANGPMYQCGLVNAARNRAPDALGNKNRGPSSLDETVFFTCFNLDTGAREGSGLSSGPFPRPCLTDMFAPKRSVPGAAASDCFYPAFFCTSVGSPRLRGSFAASFKYRCCFTLAAGSQQPLNPCPHFVLQARTRLHLQVLQLVVLYRWQTQLQDRCSSLTERENQGVGRRKPLRKNQHQWLPA